MGNQEFRTMFVTMPSDPILRFPPQVNGEMSCYPTSVLQRYCLGIDIKRSKSHIRSSNLVCLVARKHVGFIERHGPILEHDWVVAAMQNLLGSSERTPLLMFSGAVTLVTMPPPPPPPTSVKMSVMLPSCSTPESEITLTQPIRKCFQF